MRGAAAIVFFATAIGATGSGAGGGFSVFSAFGGAFCAGVFASADDAAGRGAGGGFCVFGAISGAFCGGVVFAFLGSGEAADSTWVSSFFTFTVWSDEAPGGGGGRASDEEAAGNGGGTECWSHEASAVAT